MDRLLTLFAALATLFAVSALAFPSRFSPPDLNGLNGVAVINDASGIVSTLFPPAAMLGDVNNDGMADFGQLGFGSTGLELFVVFGRRGGLAPDFSLADIDGSNGFRITDTSGILGSVYQSLAGVGDINGDGIDDMGAMVPEDAQLMTQMKGFVLYGRNGGFSVTIDYADISGAVGFRINDATERNSGNTSQMHIAAAGDVNCDGRADIGIGAPEASATQQKGDASPGAAFIIFGRAENFPDIFDLDDLNGQNGTLLTALSDSVDFGNAVQALGDFNDDGCHDLAVADLNAPPPAIFGSGAVVILFGTATPGSQIDSDTLNGNNGLVVRTDMEPAQLGALGTTLAAGDINGDDIADLVAAAPGGTGGTNSEEGGVLVLYGAAVNPALLRVNSNGGARYTHTRGFVGTTSNPGLIGVEVASGDINADGIDDVIFGSPFERPDDSRSGAGLIYAVFGRNGGLGSTFDLTLLDGNNGFVFSGEAAGDGLGGSFTMDAGDVTGDGIADILIGGTGSSDRPHGSGDNALFLLYGEDGGLILRSGFEAGEGANSVREPLVSPR